MSSGSKGGELHCLSATIAVCMWGCSSDSQIFSPFPPVEREKENLVRIVCPVHEEAVDPYLPLKYDEKLREALKVKGRHEELLTLCVDLLSASIEGLQGSFGSEGTAGAR